MLTECHECKGNVSTEARTCPHCGAPVRATAQGTSPEPATRSPAGPARTQPVPDKSRTGARIGAILGLGVVAAFFVWYFAPPSGRETTRQIAQNVIRSERTLLDETFEVPAGSVKEYQVTLGAESKLAVAVDVRSGSAIDVYLMNAEDKRSWDEARKRILGGQFQHRQALSRQGVKSYSEAAVLPGGTWWLVLKSTDPPPLLGKGNVSTVYAKVTAQR